MTVLSMRLPALLSLELVAVVSAISIEPESLRTEGVTAPLGIHATNPLLSWRLQSDRRGDNQTSYQLQAASSSDGFDAPDLWDTGKLSDRQAFASWNGSTLSSRDQFATGVNSLPLFASEFKVNCTVAKARLYITGLGVFYAELNGKSVSDEVLGPGYSTINRTVLYRAYDVTDLLTEGDNVIGVSIGKGIYNSDKPLLNRYRKFTTSTKPPILKSQLEYTCDGVSNSVVSDGTWITTTNGPLLEAAWNGGEEFDARKSIPNWSSSQGDCSDWKPANIFTGPIGGAGKLYSSTAPQLKVTETITAKLITQRSCGYLFDFGVNFAGWYQFSMNGTDKAGTRIVFWPAERLVGGNPSQTNTGSPVFDGYTLAGNEPETYGVRYRYHGLRHVCVNTTWAPQLTDTVGYVIRATNDEVGTVQTSNSFLNKLYEITDRSMKLGWLEQDHLLFDLLARRFDLQAYGYNLMHTIADAQAQYGVNSEGLIPTTAPEYDVFPDKFRDDPNWGSAIMRVVMHLYRYYGDTRVLSENYDIMVAYMDYLGRRATDSVIEGVGLSDWGAGDGKTPTVPIGLTNTFGYHQAATAMKQISFWLSNSEEVQKWDELASSIGEALHSKWFIDDTNGTTSQAYYSGNIQASDALALDSGVVPEEYQDLVFASLLTSIENTTFYPTVGEIALPSLLRVLEGRGGSDVIFKMLTSPGLSSSGLASYSYSIGLGATSLWEFLNGGRGSSGLDTAADAVRWNLINYEPILEANLTSASSSYLTPTGQASAAWELSNNVLTYDIVVPVGSVGVVSLNATQVLEGGQDVSVEQEGILAVDVDDAAEANWKVRVGSVSYQFFVLIA
ncbi:alpha-l-rhamnosidase [Colletotrichum chrysophilum]|uniref:alpha-L-rhamnosidase n=1 Tax=Colletotrichum chrysophilum TaxID=1836956 RepID=A0AAD9ESQ6_9PEZI|nr:alpha-l-rhamnosidase [Colletotrichum chrysophilum]